MPKVKKERAMNGVHFSMSSLLPRFPDILIHTTDATIIIDNNPIIVMNTSLFTSTPKPAFFNSKGPNIIIMFTPESY
jgi:hypothetical protein